MSVLSTVVEVTLNNSARPLMMRSPVELLGWPALDASHRCLPVLPPQRLMVHSHLYGWPEPRRHIPHLNKLQISKITLVLECIRLEIPEYVVQLSQYTSVQSNFWSKPRIEFRFLSRFTEVRAKFARCDQARCATLQIYWREAVLEKFHKMSADQRQVAAVQL